MTEEIFTLLQVARIAKVQKQTIYAAMKRGALKATLKDGQWLVRKEDMDEYLRNKNNRDLRKKDGEYIFDVKKGHFSVSQISKIYSASINKNFPIRKVYYLVRMGQLKSFRKGKAIVINKEDAKEFIENHTGEIDGRMKKI